MTNPDSHNVPYGLKGMVITATGNNVRDEFFKRLQRKSWTPARSKRQSGKKKGNQK
jgi:hypothetical protein